MGVKCGFGRVYPGLIWLGMVWKGHIKWGSGLEALSDIGLHDMTWYGWYGISLGNLRTG